MNQQVQYYDHEAHQLRHPQESKIRKILDHGCLVDVGNKFECRPIEGYNTTTYTLELTASGITCNCQGYHKRGSCSHQEALRRWLGAKAPQNEFIFKEER